MEVKEARRLGRVALGLEPADCILAGGDVLNVYTGEVLQRQTVLIADGRIAYVGEPVEFPTGPRMEVYDLRGKTLIPGFIDGHCHMDVWLALKEYVRWSLPRGTTAVITECPSAGNAAGKDGVRAFIRSFQGLPEKLFTTAPMIPYLSAIREEGRALSKEDMKEILTWPEVVGLGEIYWSRFLQGDAEEEIEELIATAKSLGMTVEGHSAGAKKQRLQALVALGFEGCHEPITAQEVRERLRLGLTTMIREGSIRRELETVIPALVDMQLNLRRAVLVSDGVWPHHLVKLGHMDFIVNKAVSLGLDPITAVQMVTLNVAEHFNLDDQIGAIAPGRDADIVVTQSLKPIMAELVFAKGRLVARDRTMLNSAVQEVPGQGGSGPDGSGPDSNYKLRMKPMTSEDFNIVVPTTSRINRSSSSQDNAKIRVSELVTDIVTRETFQVLPVRNGCLVTDGVGDLVKAAVIDRYEGKNRKSIGFIQGYGLKRGAIASSFSFDEGNLVVIGTNDQDMAAAVNRIRELNGGVVYIVNGQIQVELPLPLFGSASLLGAVEAAERLDAIIAALKTNGCREDHNPLLTLLTTTFSAIPSIRLSVNGYWLSKENCYRGLYEE
ncbi:MAG: adenine deaminase C-terminal domain-containing protein [Desulfitobacteriaceae bacterium]|nr:adenine deaminase C-terminal domain-containing protein [Desulfitobacteriaceae bacterium]MDI6914472.1 adenine deaminase C-terminal domain-containing protein [Desulfitobacteriaceae bacterium]